MIAYTNNPDNDPPKPITTNDLPRNNSLTHVIDINHDDFSSYPANSKRMQTNDHSKLTHLANTSQKVSEEKN